MLNRMNLNLTSIFLMVLGLLLVAYGSWSVLKFRSYVWGAGLVSLGVGSAVFGLTNGFTDLTPRGRIFTKLGIVSLIFGVLIVGYEMTKMM